MTCINLVHGPSSSKKPPDVTQQMYYEGDKFRSNCSVLSLVQHCGAASVGGIKKSFGFISRCVQ